MRRLEPIYLISIVMLACEVGAGVLHCKVNNWGYLPEVPKRFVCARSSETRFTITNQDDSLVMAGPLNETADEMDTMETQWGDFTQIRYPGAYRIIVGPDTSRDIQVGLLVDAGLRMFLKATGESIYRGRRTGDPNAEGRRAQFQDDGRRSDNLQWQDFAGGWENAGDNRKYVQDAAFAVYSMQSLMGYDSISDSSIISSARWGSTWLHKMQDPSGYLYSCGALWTKYNEGRSIDTPTDNIPNTGDERVIRVERAPLATIYIFIASQARLGRLLTAADPAFATTCLDRSRLAYDYAAAHFDEMNSRTHLDDPQLVFERGDTEFGVDIMANYVWGIIAAKEMFLATGDEKYRLFALSMAQRLLACQQQSHVGTVDPVRGFFWRSDTAQEAFTFRVPSSMVLLSLCELYEWLPDHAQAPVWKEAIRMYVHDYLLPIADRNAYRFFPAGSMYRGSFATSTRNHGGYYHSLYGKLEAGGNYRILGLGAGIARAAHILGEPELVDYAWAKLDWLMGMNPIGKVEGAADEVAFRRNLGRYAVDGCGIANGVHSNRSTDLAYCDWWMCGETYLPNNSFTCLFFSNMFSPRQTPVAVVEVDENEAVRTGTWHSNTIYLYSNTPGSTIRWTPDLPRAGLYTVYYRLPTLERNHGWNQYVSTAAPYTVQHRDGRKTTLVNCETPKRLNGWYPLGTFAFDAGTGGYVETMATDTLKVNADGIRFVEFVPTDAATSGRAPAPKRVHVPRSSPTSFVVFDTRGRTVAEGRCTATTGAARGALRMLGKGCYTLKLRFDDGTTSVVQTLSGR